MTCSDRQHFGAFLSKLQHLELSSCFRNVPPSRADGIRDQLCQAATRVADVWSPGRRVTDSRSLVRSEGGRDNAAASGRFLRPTSVNSFRSSTRLGAWHSRARQAHRRRSNRLRTVQSHSSWSDEFSGSVVGGDIAGPCLVVRWLPKRSSARSGCGVVQRRRPLSRGAGLAPDSAIYTVHG